MKFNLFTMFRKRRRKRKSKEITTALINSELKERYKKEAREATNALFKAFEDNKQIA